MGITRERRVAHAPAWVITFVSLLPLWLLSLSVSVEGFPTPPIPLWVGSSAFACGVLLIVVIVWWRRWPVIEIVPYSLLPLVLMIVFDEIITTYKTPFIFMCAILFSIGLIGFQRIKPGLLRYIFLVAGAIVPLWAAFHAAANFWKLIQASEYAQCYMFGCYPLYIHGHPWWQVFFGTVQSWWSMIFSG